MTLLKDLIESRTRIQAWFDLFEFYRRVGSGLQDLQAPASVRAMLAHAVLRLQQLNPHSGELLEALEQLARLDLAAGDAASALPSLERRHAILLEMLGPRDRETRTARVKAWACGRQLRPAFASWRRKPRADGGAGL